MSAEAKGREDARRREFATSNSGRGYAFAFIGVSDTIH